MKIVKELGRQLIVELYECDSLKIGEAHVVEQIMLDAAYAAKATIVAHKFHQFSPYGVSGTVIIAESHLSIHTWPEYRYCAVDIFTCGNLDNYQAVDLMKKQFKAERCLVTAVKRGIFSKSLGRERREVI